MNTVPASARTITLTGLKANTYVTVAVAAVTQDGQVGASSLVPIYGTTTTLTSSIAKPKSGQAFTLTAKVSRFGSSTLVPGMPVTLQRHVAGTAVWRTVSGGPTSAAGTRSWSIKQAQKTYYRVLGAGVTTWFGSTSAIKTLLMG